MANTLRKAPPSMTVAEFLAWPGDGTGRKFQLVDGEVRVMSPGSPTHGRLQSTLARLIGNALLASGSSGDVITDPGIAVEEGGKINVRIPDLGVTRTPDTLGDRLMPDPVVLIEILSPSNVQDTWENVWSYVTLPSVREVAVIHSERVLAESLRRGADAWPQQTEKIGSGGILAFESIGFSCPLAEVYARTHLGRANES